ncbi:hypothetical protein BRADI_1g71315v3 [Brachypodium distachyon]|uniref:Uncharacterized protein n=1 Tax=Brachypodium distachyon TaxID=15368 RepID=A0A0Q3LIU5_BRADI|nr:hypothetical protein BRADI_1g71315v3 [Brachypodium distachyon]
MGFGFSKLDPRSEGSKLVQIVRWFTYQPVAAFAIALESNGLTEISPYKSGSKIVFFIFFFLSKLPNYVDLLCWHVTNSGTRKFTTDLKLSFKLMETVRCGIALHLSQSWRIATSNWPGTI